MIVARDAIFDYDSLPLLGRVSRRLSDGVIVSNLRPGTWLDVLCGYRALLQLSQRRNGAITRFDSLDHRLDPALSRHGFNLTEQVVQKELPYQDDTFDNITIVNGLEHLWHPNNVLADAHRVLRVGGHLQIVVPTWFGKPILEFLAFRLQNKQAHLEMNDHKMYYDEKTLWPMLIEAGFEPKSLRLKRIKLFCSLYACATKTETSTTKTE